VDDYSIASACDPALAEPLMHFGTRFKIKEPLAVVSDAGCSLVHLVQREDDVAITVGTLGDSVLEKRLFSLSKVCLLHPFCMLPEEAIALGFQLRGGDNGQREMAFSFVVHGQLLFDFGK
jgi:hypothetical protein